MRPLPCLPPAWIGLLTTIVSFCAPASATTWDEPWHEDVVRNAVSFVQVDVLESDAEGFRARLVKHLAGETTPAEFRVTGFSMLRIGSMTMSADGHSELSLQFNPQLRYYLFLAREADTPPGEYLVATPTTGWAKVVDDGVHATYRHSYHQALVPEDLYEASQSAIFRHLHDPSSVEAQEREAVRRLFATLLTQEPRDVQEDADLFFRQHVALECFRYFGEEDDLPLLEPFLACSGWHVQISAVRALAGVDCEESRARLLEFLRASDRDPFAQVMAVWGLRRQDDRSVLPRLKELLPTASERETGFGGNIMDPRIGTRFPDSVKVALEKLIREWEAD